MRAVFSSSLEKLKHLLATSRYVDCLSSRSALVDSNASRRALYVNGCLWAIDKIVVVVVVVGDRVVVVCRVFTILEM